MRRSKRILAVDDNPLNLRILEEILSGEFTLEVASRGEDAIRLACRRPPAVILLDVMMPGMDGLETCRSLRQKAELRDAAIIMVSAKAMPSEQVAGINCGADGYITKPFDEVELLTLLRHYTSHSWSGVAANR